MMQKDDGKYIKADKPTQHPDNFLQYSCTNITAY